MKKKVATTRSTETKERRDRITTKVRKSARMANTLAKALPARVAHRWQFMDFLGPGGNESAGVVDLLAIRRNFSKIPSVAPLKQYDLFDIMLVQVKGGDSPMPTNDDKARLKIVKDRYGALEIVLFEWNNRKGITRFSRLDESLEWQERTATQLFGKAVKA